MLAALLCHVQSPGGESEREKRIVEALRKDYFERQKEVTQEPEISQGAIIPKNVFHVPVLPADTAQAGITVGDNEDEVLALVLIIAEL